MERWPVALRLSLPALFVLPYGMVSIAAHIFQWMWFALYAVLPVAIAWLLMRAAQVDPEPARRLARRLHLAGTGVGRRSALV